MKQARAARVRAGVLLLCGLLLPAGIAVTPAAATPAAPSLRTLVIPNPGAGYTVTSEGPLHPSEFAASSPDPAALAGALATLAPTVSAYERVWEDDGGANQVQDLLVHFPSVVGAQVFLRVAQRALQSGEVVSTGPLGPIPGARRTVYFAAATRAGVGQVVTMRGGTYVDLLSFLSQASAHAQPISPADALRVARGQQAAIVGAPDGTLASTAGAAKKGVSLAAVGWAALAVAVLAVAVATPLILRRHRARTPDVGSGPPVGAESSS